MKQVAKNYLRHLAGLFALATVMMSGAAWGKGDLIYTASFSNTAAGGYDVTAYFTAGEPVKGEKAFKTKYQGANWHFASQENLNKFIENPQKYAPQYGGYCAYAVAKNSTARGSPLHWTIHQDKLYLNYNKGVNVRWVADKERFIATADQNWPAVLE